MSAKKISWIILLSLLLTLFAATSALAEHGDPLGDCPRGFSLVHEMDHTNHMHKHIGIMEDINGDDFVCMRHLPKDLHLHVDNYLPLE